MSMSINGVFKKRKIIGKREIKVRLVPSPWGSHRPTGEVRLHLHRMELNGGTRISSSRGKNLHCSESKHIRTLAECYVNEIINMLLFSYMLQSRRLCKEHRSMAIFLKLNIQVGLIAEIEPVYKYYD
jgi:hypothetical protein